MVYNSTRNRELVGPAVRECFATDKELLSQWHVAAPADLDACTERTMSDLSGTSFADPSFVFHRAYEGGELAGYWGSELNGSYLNLIFLKPAFRTGAFKTEFWRAIEQSMKSPFTTAVYLRNQPALSFYSKRCVEKFPHLLPSGDRAVVFQFNSKVKV